MNAAQTGASTPVRVSAPPSRRTCAVVVTYRPDVALLREAVASIAPQVDDLVLVDNSTQCPEFDALASKLADGHAVLRNEGNLGLAAGFNAGIAHARARGHDFVLLLDQDSVAAPDMVTQLISAFEALSRDARVAAVGPRFVDPRSRAPGAFVRIGFPLNHKIVGGDGERIACDFLISSGSLVPLSVIDDVGMMDESLFIDNVDLDWCFRAQHLGYALYGVCDARMRHSIGDTLRPSRWRRRGIFIHAPVRLYYLTRNRLLLYRRAHTPLVWIAQDVPRLVGKFLSMSLLIPPRGANAWAMLQGIRDGLLGRAGPKVDP